MAKAYRKGIAHETKCRSDKKLGRVFVDLGGRKDVASVGGKEYPMIARDGCIRRTWMYFLASVGGKAYPMIVRDDCIRRTWMYFLKHKSDAASAFRSFLASVRADGKPSLVEIVRSDNGGEFFRGNFESL